MKEQRNQGGDAVTNLLLVTFRLNGAFLGAADSIAAPSGLTAARWQVLGSVTRQGKTVSQIAREMGLARQSVQRIANVLDDESLVEYLDNPEHQRAKLVLATKTGVTAIKDLAQRQYQWANSVAEGFSANELENSVELLHKVANRLQELEKKSP